MIQKNYQKLLELHCKELKKKNKDIFDIVLYGSIVKGKSNSNDIDILVIFHNTKLKERLDIIQDLKKKLKKYFEKLDIKSVNLNEFLDKTFLARQNILIEGISLINKKPLSESLGFKGYTIFTYNLSNLNHNEKTKFNYALMGRNSKGTLKTLDGISLGKGVVQIPIQTSLSFEEFLKKWNINYKSKNVLIPFY